MPEIKDIENQSAFQDNGALYNKQTKAVPAPEEQIGIDTQRAFFDAIANAGIAGKVDLSAIESFTQVSQSRNQIYSLLDTMCEDSTVAAILETYAEDATEYSDNGHIVWAESSDPDVAKYISFLLESMCVDKNVYKWVHSLCKYGDLYLRIYRQSEYDDPLFKEEDAEANTRSTLNEDVKVKAYSVNDHYVHYLEMVPNPAEIFELTKFGKTHAYIKTATQPTASQTTGQPYVSGSFYQYKFKKRDVEVFGATEYVHACLEDNTSRTPEQVQIFLNEKDFDNDSNALNYTVKRGQSLLYNTFKIWRELALLENSILLNRITKSSKVRVIGVEVGDMPKEMVGPHLQSIKSLIEQKTAIEAGTSFAEYTNPGPIENNIYVPTKDGKGALTTQEFGGDVNVGQLTDLDYFQDKFFGAMRVPKQYFGITDDNAGFSGGQSLSIISSRYAKMIKRIQNCIMQVLTDAINLMCIDKGLNQYVNKFTIKMLPPTTQEEIDRRENLSGKIQITSEVMNMLADVEDNSIKLKILKSLLASVITNTEVVELLQEEIDRIEREADTEEETSVDTANTGEDEIDSGTPLNLASDLGLAGASDLGSETAGIGEEGGETEAGLPTPEELGVGDFSDNENFD